MVNNTEHKTRLGGFATKPVKFNNHTIIQLVGQHTQY